MKNFIKILGFVSLVLFSNNLLANNCAELIHEFKECKFNINETESGKSAKSVFKSEQFDGIALSICKDGVHEIKSVTCNYNPVMEMGSCNGLKANTWSDNETVCKHPDINKEIKAGEKIKINATNAFGSIDYKCENGFIKIENTVCGKEKTETVIGAQSYRPIPSGFVCKDNIEVPFGSNPPYYVDVETCSNACSAAGYNGKVNFLVNNNQSGFTCACDCAFKQTSTPPTTCQSSCPAGQTLEGSQCVETTSPIKVCYDRYQSPPTGINNRTCEYSTSNYSQVEDTCVYVLEQCREGSILYDLNDTIYKTQSGIIPNSFSCPSGFSYTDGTCKKSTPATQTNCGECKGQMLGTAAEALFSGVPYFCENGVCYQDSCKINNSSFAGNFCTSCPLNNVTFTTADNVDGSCNVTLNEIFSGDNKNQDFFNNQYNGHVSYYCMNGVSEINSSTCFKNCKPENVTWGSSSGLSYHIGLNKAGLCNANITSQANFRNAERSEVLNSTVNTGNAIFRCNGSNGNWVSDREDCKLDCPSTAYWYDTHNNISNVNDRSGRRKGFNASTGANTNMACSFNVTGSRQDGRTINAVSTGSNVGSAALTCKDGYWEMQSGTCNLHCNHTIPSTTLTSGGRTCSFPSNSSFGVRGHNTTVNYNNNDFQNNGNVVYRCNDGQWDLESFSCAPKPCPNGTLTWTGSGQTCVANPPATTEGTTRNLTDSTYVASGQGTGSAQFSCVGTSTSTNATWQLQGGSSCIRSFDGACDNSVTNGCQTNRGNAFNTSSTSSQWFWNCSGGGIGGNSSQCSKYKPAVCNNSTFGGCSVGSSGGLSSNSTTTFWTCTNGTESANCSKAKDVAVSNGSCGSTRNTCVSGSVFNQSNPATYIYTWSCSGAPATPTNVAGSPSDCSVDETPASPNCGTASGTTRSTAPTSGLCGTGASSSISTGTNNYTWSCTNGGNTANCSAFRTALCGSSNGGSFTNAPTSGLCTRGSSSAVSSGANFAWSCSNGSSTVNCSATKTVTPPPPMPTCGTVSGTVRSSIPTSNLCGVGTNTTITTTTNNYSWNCNNGGNSVGCFAYRSPVCGSSNGGTFPSSPTSGLCNRGTNSSVSEGSNFTWTCSNGGTSVSCSANKQAASVCRYDTNNYISIEEEDYSGGDYGTGQNAYTYNREIWVYNGVIVYSYLRETGRYGNTNEEFGSKAGYRAGATISSDNGAGVNFPDWYEYEGEICNN